MMTTNFEFNADGSFQCALSILGQFPAFLPHTRLHRALSITVPSSSPCVKLSIGELSMELSQIGRAWHPVTVTYHPCLPRPPCTHWHSYIPPTPGSPKPKLGHLRETIAVVRTSSVPAYYNCSPLYLQQISISICFVPRGG